MPCSNVKLTATTSEQADSISSPFTQVVSTNPFIFNLDRKSEEQTITFLKDEKTVTQKIRIPLLLSSYFVIDKVGTPANAAISVEKLPPISFSTPLIIEYSIDNVNWQTSGYFNGITEGDYTLYIRDNIGCATTKSFSIDAFTPNLLDYDGICDVSNLNSIRYKENVVWNDTILPTPYNTLSFEEDVRNPNKSFTQPFNKEDVIRTQIKTNYETLSAKIIDVNGTEAPLSISRMTANMDITDVRDAYILETQYNGTGYTSVKYSGGMVYDPITLAGTTDYNLGENVPSWMNIDDYINIEGVGWYKVLDVVYSVNAYVLIVNLLSSDFPIPLNTTKKVTSVYNAVDWESYEFEINFATYQGYYKVQIDVSDDNFGSKSYLSEWLNIKERHAGVFLIEAYNTENNEINYSTGFTIKLRLPKLMDLVWSPSTEQDIYVTDTNTVPLENKYRGFWEITSNVLPSAMAEKLTLILLQDRLFINGISYQTEGEVTANTIGSQYQIKANLVKSDYVFDSNSNKGLGIVTVADTLLSISQDGGFLFVD